MMILLTIFVSVVSALLTYYISFNLNRGTVFASALVTLSGGILFRFFTAEWAMGMGAVVACASYAAMVSQQMFPKIKSMIYVGIVCGIIFALANDVFVGVGGKLGVIAAVSGFTVVGARELKEKIFA